MMRHLADVITHIESKDRYRLSINLRTFDTAIQCLKYLHIETSLAKIRILYLIIPHGNAIATI